MHHASAKIQQSSLQEAATWRDLDPDVLRLHVTHAALLAVQSVQSLQPILLFSNTGESSPTGRHVPGAGYQACGRLLCVHACYTSA